MKASVRAFLHQIIDYAGLFPPAKLPMADAVRIYLHEKKLSPHRWMLSRFVCPTTRLPELLTVAKSHEDAALLSVSAIFPPSATAAEYYPDLDKGVIAIESFHRAWGNDGVVDMVEIVLPKEPDFLQRAPIGPVKLWETNLVDFLEIPGATWPHAWKKILGLLHLEHRGGPKRLKLRCGGVTAEAFPSNQQVAHFITQCRDNGSIWKATAGLHHPRRHWDAALNVWHHGFLNVFGAGLLAMAHPLTQANLIEILADRDGAGFRFEENEFAWKEWSCTTEQIAEFRAAGPTSFGSCSFEEPCQDLRALEMLDDGA